MARNSEARTLAGGGTSLPGLSVGANVGTTRLSPRRAATALARTFLSPPELELSNKEGEDSVLPPACRRPPSPLVPTWSFLLTSSYKDTRSPME